MSSFHDINARTEAELKDKLFCFLVRIREIKDEMLELEYKISSSLEQDTTNLQKELKNKSDDLNALSDTMVSTSNDAWGKYRLLTKLCEKEGVDPKKLEQVHSLCKKFDTVTADLLCYSLGH